MARDTTAVKYHLSVTVLVTPVNQYGDELATGSFHYEVNIQERKLSDAMARLERITEDDAQ